MTPSASHTAIIPHEASTVDKIITGTTRIAKFLRVSRMTVLRMIESKRLAAFKTGGNTSPWKCWLSEIERVRRVGGLDEHHLEAAE